jgi:hypothetical protein
MPRTPAARADQVADALLAWLDVHTSAPPPHPGPAHDLEGEAVAARARPGAEASRAPAAAAAAHPQREEDRPAIAPAHTDWLYHQLRIDGPAGPVHAFRSAAAGAGIIPWHLDLDRMEEDFFHRLVAPPAGQARTLGLEGARMLAAELRDAVARRHALAMARVGRSQACPFDLHALLPVPQDILRLGPDHPDALSWLWARWGTTQALRHIALAPAPPSRSPAPADTATFRLSFWSADWTPWRALAAVQVQWPALRFAIAPQYALA